MRVIYGFAAFMSLNVFCVPILGALVGGRVSETTFVIIAIVYMAVLSYLFKRWLDKQPVDL